MIFVEGLIAAAAFATGFSFWAVLGYILAEKMGHDLIGSLSIILGLLYAILLGATVSGALRGNTDLSSILACAIGGLICILALGIIFLGQTRTRPANQS